MKRIAMFALFGAVGFGVGGLFPGPAALLAFALGFQQTAIWPSGVIAFAVLAFGFAAKGALGGTALGLALRKGRRIPPLAMDSPANLLQPAVMRIGTRPIT